MSDTRARLAGWAMAAALATGSAGAAARGGTLNLVWENDLFSGRDRHYTNGLQVLWVPETAPPEWLRRVARVLPAGEMRHAYAIGHAMFTAEDITLAEPPPGQPPYAGWLYGSAAVSVRRGRKADQLTLTLGVVGPAALGEQGQKFVHKLTGSEPPRGWDTQLDNEPGVMVTYLHSRRGDAVPSLGSARVDLTTHFGGALGNVYTYANAGFTLRYGNWLPRDDGPLRIQPGPPGPGLHAAGNGGGWFLFAGVDGRAIARKIFLDGNAFDESRSVDKVPFVADLQLGVAWAWRGMRLAYTQVLRTREYENQRDPAAFGALSVTFPL